MDHTAEEFQKWYDIIMERHEESLDRLSNLLRREELRGNRPPTGYKNKAKKLHKLYGELKRVYQANKKDLSKASWEPIKELEDCCADITSWFHNTHRGNDTYRQ